MRFVVFGAGAIGGVVGGRLHEHGHDVLLIARRQHHDAIAAGGLRLESPEASITLPLPVVRHPREVDFGPDDVILLAVKSQDTADALRALAPVASPTVPVFCAQNGVENERLALRLFPNVYSLSVMCPTAHLLPGVVQAYSAPTTGIMDLGRYPSGVDDIATGVAAALRGSTFSSEALPDIGRWKYANRLLG
ncbi:MAG: 2-dehydropantoate 2-reductase [Acidimicrobiales bacterium]